MCPLISSCQSLTKKSEPRPCWRAARRLDTAVVYARVVVYNIMRERRSAQIASTDAPADRVSVGAAFGSDPASVASRSVLRASPSAAPRILFVEDDFILRAHLAELLMLEGYTVSCAADGAEALRRLQNEPPPSVILADIVLPRLDGIAFRRAQLQLPAFRDIPAIAVTSLRDIGGVQAARFSDVIKKPLDFDHLLDLLAKLCPRA